MYSDGSNACSHALGFPIRTSPDHSLLAATRSLSQLITSFIACLRQGIHTHALSSLTIKSTSHPGRLSKFDHPPGHRCTLLSSRLLVHRQSSPAHADPTAGILMPVNIQLSKIDCPEQNPGVNTRLPDVGCCSLIITDGKDRRRYITFMVGLGRIELPTSPLSGVRSSHLSYRPRLIANLNSPLAFTLVELVGIEPATS